jgi:hypothetical protein
MIAKFARYRGTGGGRQVSAATVARGDNNHALRRVFGDPQRRLRRVLVCHWQVRPQTGALECVWETQTLKRPAHADEEPKLRGPGGEPRGPRPTTVSRPACAWTCKYAKFRKSSYCAATRRRAA